MTLNYAVYVKYIVDGNYDVAGM